MTEFQLNCCGVDSYENWGEVIRPPNHPGGITVNNITVPDSCCAGSVVDQILDIEECTKLYANGCLPRVIYVVYESAGLLGAGAMTIAFIQVSIWKDLIDYIVTYRFRPLDSIGVKVKMSKMSYKYSLIVFSALSNYILKIWYL